MPINDYQLSENQKVCEDTSSRKVSILILLSAFLISIPVFLVVLMLIKEPLQSFEKIHYPHHSTDNGTRPDGIKGLGGINFAPIQLKPIESTDELMKEVLFVVKTSEEPHPKRLYLRAATFDIFNNRAMESSNSHETDSSWPNFAFSVAPQPNADHAKAEILFYCNYEARLPYPPVTQAISGSVRHSAMADASLKLDETIAEGDIFNTSYQIAEPPGENDAIVQFSGWSGFLQTGNLENTRLQSLADEIAGNGAPSFQMVGKFVEFLEKNGTYRADHLQATDIHPVEYFLLNDLKGHCQHFAGALTLLCRLKKIPARVVGGYLTTARSDEHFLVTGGMAHAWVEILTNKGWKRIDVSPMKSETPEVIANSVSMPSVAQLDDFKKKNKSEHENGDESAEGAGGKKRNGGKGVAEKSFGHHPDISKYLQQTMNEKEKPTLPKKKEKRNIEWLKILLRIMLGIAAISLIIWFSSRHGEKLLKWLYQLLHQKEQRTRTAAVVEQKALNQQLMQHLATSDLSLGADDLADIFSRFLMIMQQKPVFARIQHETPREYFARLCKSIQISEANGEKAASCIEAKVYGNKTIMTIHQNDFLNFLQTILKTLN